MSRLLITFAGLLTISAAIGCRGGMFAHSAPPSTFADPLSSSSDLANSSALENNHGSDPHQEQSLLSVIDELTELGALDETDKRDLMADLQEADPKSWPIIVKQYRSALAFRKQLAEREGQAEADLVTDVDQLRKVAKVDPAQDTRTRRHRSRHDAQMVEVAANQTSPAMSYPTEIEGVEEVVASDERPAAQAIVLSKPPELGVRQASYTNTHNASLGWKQHLDMAVENMQSSLPADPVSTDEVNEHMRLRLLQLLAGNRDAALQPIPGATAPQQDYWSQQLFAVSTFLDSQSQPDNKRRATGSLTYLDQARAKLAELATLQVRSLAFVDAVDGYGAYTLREAAKFKPGEAVTLYAEIENFTTEATKDGHRTRLGTSFEILDKNGKRIDSAQFPEVEDVCKTPRRDFHMQYTVTLPTRIYADEYKIRLIVTDEQSRKIGQSSLAFEIAE